MMKQQDGVKGDHKPDTLTNRNLIVSVSSQEKPMERESKAESLGFTYECGNWSITSRGHNTHIGIMHKEK